MSVCKARRPVAYRPFFKSKTAFSYRTLSGSTEAPATGAASFFLPRHPVRSVAASAVRHTIRPVFNVDPYAGGLHASLGVQRQSKARALNLNFLRQCAVGCLFQHPDGLCRIGGV